MNPILIEFPDTLQTKRLLIRSPLPGDGPELQVAVAESIQELKVWMPWATSVPTLEEAEENVRKAHLEFLARKDLRLHLFLKSKHTLIGCSGLHRIDWKVPKFEIGYWCRTPYVGRGYIREAVAEITRFAFEQLKAQRVEIRCDPLNERSRKIPEALGFQLEAVFRHDDRAPNGELRDTMVFAKTLAD